MKRVIYIFLSLVLVLAFILSGCSSPTTTTAKPATTTAPASATPSMQPITLKFNGAQFGANDVPGMSYNWFCNAVTEKTKGLIKFQYVGSNSLTKPTEEVAAMQNGIIDVGAFSMTYYAAPMYVNLGFPRAVPFDIVDIPTATKAAYGLYYDNPATSKILSDEFTKQGLKFLFMTIDDSYVIESKAPIATIADLKGMKIAAMGGEAKFLAQAAATIQGMPAADRGTALQTGVIEAGSAPFEISYAARTYEFAPYMIQTGFGCVTGNAVTWNLNKFNALPKDIQDIIVQAGKDAFMQNAVITMNWYTTALETRAKATGNKPVSTFSAEEQTKWAALVGEPVTDWIKVAPANSGADVVVKAWIAAEKAAGFKFPKEWATP